MLKKIVKVLDDLNLKDIKIYKMENKSPYYDYLIIASSTSNRQNAAVIKHIKEMASENNFIIKNVEGSESSWVLVDMYDVILHVFSVSDRKYYDLDKLYFDYEKIDVSSILK